MLKSLVGLIIITHTVCIIDPSHFSEQIRSKLPKQVSILHKDIARTVNGYTVMAYGLTAIPQIPKQFQFRDFSYYPSSFIISYMHGTDQNAVNLLYGFIINLFRDYQLDYYMQYVLKTGFIWLVPFFSIDAYQIVYRNLKESQTKIQNNQNKKEKENDQSKEQSQQIEEQQSVVYKKMTMKNMNRFPDNNRPLVFCQKKFKDKFSGVDLNFNFLRQNGTQYSDLCSDTYAGPHPFSQMQTNALRKLFQTLGITVVIDLQIGQDTWVYPTREIWIQQNKYANLYKDIIKKLHKHNINITQQNTTIIDKDKKDDKSYSGGFVNWAATQDTLAFKYLITNNLQGQQLKKSISSAFSVMNTLLKKNAPIYNKFRSQDSKRMYVQSISVNQFTIRCQIKTNLGETVETDYTISPGKIVQITINLEQQNFLPISSPKQTSQINLSILDSFITQKIQISTLPLITELPPEQVPHPRPRSTQKRLFVLQIIFVVGFVGCILVGGLVLTKLSVNKKKDHKNKLQYISLKDNENVSI